MKLLVVFSVFVSIFVSGCAVSKPQDFVNKQPVELKDIRLPDLQTATGEAIKALLESDVLKKKEQSIPFVMVGIIDNKLIPKVNTDVISQDIRMAILTSDKAVTMSESAKKASGKNNKKADKKDVLPSFDYYLSGEVVKDKYPGPNSEQECYALRFKLKDLKSKLVIWEHDSKLLK